MCAFLFCKPRLWTFIRHLYLPTLIDVSYIQVPMEVEYRDAREGHRATEFAKAILSCNRCNTPDSTHDQLVCGS